MWEFIVKNKEWLFSGLVLTIVGWFVTWMITAIYSKKTAQTAPKKIIKESNVVQGNVSGNVNIKNGDSYSAGRDLNIAEGGGKVTVINGSKIGVVGDNTRINKLDV